MSAILRCTTALFAAVAFGVLPAAAQACPEGTPRTAKLGIERFVCRAGSCAVNVRVREAYMHDFAVEPSIGGIVPDGPADGVLRVGDVVASIDGVPVTTPEGGRRLAQLEPGRAVTLGIRRDGETLEVRITPEARCDRPGLIVYGGEDVAPPRPPVVGLGLPAAPRVRFGLRLDCVRCGWFRRPGGALRFRTAGPVRVEAVERSGPGERAGFRTGDTIVAVDGEPIGSAAAARRLGALEPGDDVVFGVRRGTRELRLTVRAGAGEPPSF